ncbi:MAG: acetyl-CoA carboxylase biotin carboxyl carrier protein subunit [Polyangiales bacterium]
MRYFVTLDGDPAHERAIDVEVRPTGELVVMSQGRRIDADVVRFDDGTWSVHVDGRVIDLTIEGAPPDVGVVASGTRAYVRVESDRLRAAAAAKRGGASGGDKVVQAPMPGRIVKVLVEVGDTVAQGQGLVVVEAMKMENELRAKGPGTVAAIHVKAGETIEAGTKLLSLG